MLENSINRCLAMSQEKLIQLLSDGQFHTGSEVGELLGVTRAAIWKQIQKLDDLGLEAESIKGKGYRLKNKIDLLSRDKILSRLGSLSADVDDIEVHSVVGSTNDLLLAAASQKRESGLICLAEFQNSGRGRRGKTWVSPYGGNIYMSLLWRFSGGASALEGLSLVVGLAIARALESEGLPRSSLKWPNDVHVDGKKICGVLIEMAGDMTGPCSVVIGIGVNVHMPKTSGSEIDQPWTDLSSELNEAVDRNAVVGALIENLIPMLKGFEVKGFAGFRDDWMRYDGYRDQKINLIMGDKTVPGIERGIDSTGGLMVELESGKVEVFKGGEVSLRLSQ